MKMFENIAAEPEELDAVAITWASQSDVEVPFDAAGMGSHYDNSIAHVDGFVNVVGDQQDRSAAVLPKAQHFILHPHPGKSGASAEGPVPEGRLGRGNEWGGESGA